MRPFWFTSKALETHHKFGYLSCRKGSVPLIVISSEARNPCVDSFDGANGGNDIHA
jgi:hypothetical protein